MEYPAYIEAIGSAKDRQKAQREWRNATSAAAGKPRKRIKQCIDNAVTSFESAPNDSLTLKALGEALRDDFTEVLRDVRAEVYEDTKAFFANHHIDYDDKTLETEAQRRLGAVFSSRQYGFTLLSYLLQRDLPYPTPATLGGFNRWKEAAYSQLVSPEYGASLTQPSRVNDVLPIIHACDTHAPNLVRHMLRHGGLPPYEIFMQLEEVDHSKHPILYFAAANERGYNKLIVQLLAKDPALLEAVRSHKVPVLSYAASAGNSALIRTLIEEFAVLPNADDRDAWLDNEQVDAMLMHMSKTLAIPKLAQHLAELPDAAKTFTQKLTFRRVNTLATRLVPSMFDALCPWDDAPVQAYQQSKNSGYLREIADRYLQPLHQATMFTHNNMLPHRESLRNISETMREWAPLFGASFDPMINYYLTQNGLTIRPITSEMELEKAGKELGICLEEDFQGYANRCCNPNMEDRSHIVGVYRGDELLSVAEMRISAHGYSHNDGTPKDTEFMFDRGKKTSPRFMNVIQHEGKKRPYGQRNLIYHGATHDALLEFKEAIQKGTLAILPENSFGETKESKAMGEQLPRIFRAIGFIPEGAMPPKLAERVGDPEQRKTSLDDVLAHFAKGDDAQRLWQGARFIQPNGRPDRAHTNAVAEDGSVRREPQTLFPAFTQDARTGNLYQTETLSADEWLHVTGITDAARALVIMPAGTDNPDPFVFTGEKRRELLKDWKGRDHVLQEALADKALSPDQMVRARDAQLQHFQRMPKHAQGM